MNIQDNIYQRKDDAMKPRFVRICPVCGDMDAMRNINDPNKEICKSCTSEWDSNGNLILDMREGLSETEVLSKGWFVDIKN